MSLLLRCCRPDTSLAGCVLQRKCRNFRTRRSYVTKLALLLYLIHTNGTYKWDAASLRSVRSVLIPWILLVCLDFRSLRSEKVAYLQNHKELGVETEGGTVPYIAALDDVIRLLISEGVVVFLWTNLVFRIKLRSVSTLDIHSLVRKEVLIWESTHGTLVPLLTLRW